MELHFASSLARQTPGVVVSYFANARWAAALASFGMLIVVSY
jgi:hypothetical protein